jgi:hypothetical protein
MFEAHVGAHVVLNVHYGVDDVSGEKAAGAQSIKLWVEEDCEWIGCCIQDRRGGQLCVVCQVSFLKKIGLI